mmetsp:Transcript_19010/g.50879  ORF Transcript_19010/g.50879 Transcript_19010/m.50879 type:complete len:243 (-) Transcript_19010:1118-1846(-)
MKLMNPSCGVPFRRRWRSFRVTCSKPASLMSCTTAFAWAGNVSSTSSSVREDQDPADETSLVLGKNKVSDMGSLDGTEILYALSKSSLRSNGACGAGTSTSPSLFGTFTEEPCRRVGDDSRVDTPDAGFLSMSLVGRGLPVFKTAGRCKLCSRRSLRHSAAASSTFPASRLFPHFFAFKRGLARTGAGLAGCFPPIVQLFRGVRSDRDLHTGEDGAVADCALDSCLALTTSGTSVINAEGGM